MAGLTLHYTHLPHSKAHDSAVLLCHVGVCRLCSADLYPDMARLAPPPHHQVISPSSPSVTGGHSLPGQLPVQDGHLRPSLLHLEVPAAEGWDVLPVLSKSGESYGPGAELLPPVWPGGCPDRGHSDRGHCAHHEGGVLLDQFVHLVSTLPSCLMRQPAATTVCLPTDQLCGHHQPAAGHWPRSWLPPLEQVMEHSGPGHRGWHTLQETDGLT